MDSGIDDGTSFVGTSTGVRWIRKRKAVDTENTPVTKETPVLTSRRRTSSPRSIIASETVPSPRIHVHHHLEGKNRPHRVFTNVLITIGPSGSKGDPSFCTICHDTIGRFELTALHQSCGVAYHSECLTEWNLTKIEEAAEMRCPNCRASFDFSIDHAKANTIVTSPWLMTEYWKIGRIEREGMDEAEQRRLFWGLLHGYSKEVVSRIIQAFVRKGSSPIDSIFLIYSQICEVSHSIHTNLEVIDNADGTEPTEHMIRDALLRDALDMQTSNLLEPTYPQLNAHCCDQHHDFATIRSSEDWIHRFELWIDAVSIRLRKVQKVVDERSKLSEKKKTEEQRAQMARDLEEQEMRTQQRIEHASDRRRRHGEQAEAAVNSQEIQQTRNRAQCVIL